MASKFINEAETVVDDSLRAFVSLHKQTRLLKECPRVVVRSTTGQQEGCVALVAGGGSGHEPAFAGFVGRGALTAAVAGNVFASPPPAHVLAALRAVANPEGVLVLIINYTGDRLNFGLAVERAAHELSGCGRLRSVVVGEDTALVSADKNAGRRGLAGCLFAVKIAGAMAEAQSHSVDEIAAEVQRVASCMGTIGLSLSSCSLPGKGAAFSLDAGQMELGLGIHGEPGVARIAVQPAAAAVATMLDHMTNANSASAFHIAAGDCVAVLVNNLGGLSQIEMNVLCGEVLAWLEKRSVVAKRFYSGTLMTSLEMRGVSISILRLEDEVWEICLDAPTDCAAWPKSTYVYHDEQFHEPVAGDTDGLSDIGISLDERIAETKQSGSLLTGDEARGYVAAVCDALDGAETLLNELDAAAGDGDCGSTMRRGAQAVRQSLDDGSLRLDDAAQLCQQLSEIWEGHTGGTTGALGAILLSSIGRQLRDGAGWTQALAAALAAVQHYGHAEPGDRTMVDALHAAVEALRDGQTLVAAAEAAETAARRTATMRARAGRASYVAAEQQTRDDAGATAVAICLRAVATHHSTSLAG